MPLVREGSEGDMMRILIVEGDRELAAALDDALRYEGYATSLATTGVEALKILAGTNVDIMLLDRDLPVLSGDAVMATVAANRIPVAVIMLTAAADPTDVIKTTIYSLRRKLADREAIVSTRGEGYRLQ